VTMPFGHVVLCVVTVAACVMGTVATDVDRRTWGDDEASVSDEGMAGMVEGVDSTSAISILLLLVTVAGGALGALFAPRAWFFVVVQLLRLRSSALMLGLLRLWDIALGLSMAFGIYQLAVGQLPTSAIFGRFVAGAFTRFASLAVPICVTCVMLPQESCAKQKAFTKCHHMRAGGWKDDTQQVYLRKHAVDEWKELCKFNKALHIEGPPGTGKSTIAWVWACFTAQSANVVWVHRDADGGSRISLVGAGYIVYFDFPARLESHLGMILSACALLARANIIIVDGITNKRKDLFGDTVRWANASPHRRAVLVTSAQIVFPGQFKADYNISTFSMPSWTFDQYRKACENDTFYNAVKWRLGWVEAKKRLDPTQDENDYKNELLGDKFFQAGFSARWMFSLSSSQLTKVILDYVDKVESYDQLAAGLTGTRATAAIGHLVAKDEHRNHFLVSRAVTRAVVDKCEAKAITMAARLSKKYGNGAFDGWVFEFDFLMNLRLAAEPTGSQSVTLTVGEHALVTSEEWKVDRQATVYHAADLEGLDNADFAPHSWYIPQKVNQGGFDVVMVTGPNSLRFVQLTVASHHSQKLKYLREFGTAWETACQRDLTSVELVAVVPAGRLSEFKWKSKEGSVPKQWKLKVRKVSFQRTGIGPSL